MECILVKADRNIVSNLKSCARSEDVLRSVKANSHAEYLRKRQCVASIRADRRADTSVNNATEDNQWMEVCLSANFPLCLRL